MSVKLPNGNVMMIDCGSNPNTGFSPITKLGDYGDVI
jgi:hypothetical protein